MATKAITKTNGKTYKYEYLSFYFSLDDKFTQYILNESERVGMTPRDFVISLVADKQTAAQKHPL
jgi:hypothetical protein